MPDPGVGGPSEPGVSPYQHYVYAYPHKTAYRPLADRPALRELWAGEPKDALALYAHVPFCEVRCGFCNLFTRVGAPGELTTRYLDALERQATAVRRALDEADTPARPLRFASAAFGGGTPTYLSAAELTRLCDIAELRMGTDLRAVPLSVETSPSTATPDRLAVLAERGATRISIGVQSFVPSEARAAVRPQRRSEVEAALGHIRASGVPVLNIDLIYGIDGQTERSWRTSLDAALAWRPEELYLYPLYVRPLTGLDRRDGAAGSGAGRAEGSDPEWDARRLRLYRAGRDHLLAQGYEQVSMRMFRRAASATPPNSSAPPSSSSIRSASSAPPGGPAPDHACQTDGMIGLGCGARSYTAALHYSFDYAVDMREIRGIIDDFTATRDFSHATVGRYQDADEARRRHLLQSLLQAAGLPIAEYRARFGSTPAADYPTELARLAAYGWLDTDARTPEGGELLRLSPEGLAHSDAVGPLLFSPAVRAAMAEYAPR
ncbi:STM4012 family radical SAM protein [Streptomyces oceani]|uniref:Heme chaperone HemW n=1 Tax=Streptomyces oceani TaxID=1075402 RepID=A0A1E7JXH4_9ACTN|nr:STM4012 family radical SAM protein [Streptomyces oceani]OEU96354.1 coproporphyrinogen III oxidase [Streptomyces oceani]